MELVDFEKFVIEISAIAILTSVVSISRHLTAALLVMCKEKVKYIEIECLLFL